jgi:chromosome partitioning protein
VIILSVANQKGGTGKTTTVRELGAILSASGLRVLLVDLDPQGSLTAACGLGDQHGHTLAEVLGGAQPGRLTIGEVVQELSGGLWIVTADITLASAELGLTARMGRESVLRRALMPIGSNYDLAILDCPPSLGLLTVAGLVAADGVVIPTAPQAADLRGLMLFVETARQIQSELNPGLELVGVLVTFYDARMKHHQQAMEFINQADLHVLGTVGRSVRVAESAGIGQPVTVSAPDNPQAEAYRKIAEEIQKWLKKRTGPTQ